MSTAHQSFLPKLSNRQTKLIKSLRLKKYRQQENAFVVEGGKNVTELLTASHPLRMLIGTPSFLATNQALWQDQAYPVFQTEASALPVLGSLTTNRAALAVVPIPTKYQEVPPANTWGLALDNINDPGNLGTIVRIADWYNIPTVVCSPTTVDLYSPKVLQASMGSFLRVRVHYAPLPMFLDSTSHPIVGTFTQGDNLHQTPLPFPGWIVIGNESKGISPEILPYIKKCITIPRYGQAESLNAAIATAIICDHWRQQ